MAHEAGKGSRPRPFSIAQDEYEKRWDAIFGRDLDEEKYSRNFQSNENETLQKNNDQLDKN